MEETVVSTSPRDTDMMVDKKNVNFLLIAMYLRYFYTKNRISVFVAGGPLISYGKDKVNNERISIPDQTGTNIISEEMDSVNWNLGLAFAFGTEYFITSELSLTAEYGISIFYQHAQSDRVRRGGTDSSGENYRMDTSIANKGYNLGGQGVKFGVSVYF